MFYRGGFPRMYIYALIGVRSQVRINDFFNELEKLCKINNFLRFSENFYQKYRKFKV